MTCLPSSVSVTLVPVSRGPLSTVYSVLFTPESASCGVRVTSTLLLTQPLGAETSVLGAVLSILTGSLVALVVLPALSETEAEAVCPSPSVDRIESAGLSPARPERASSADQVCVTSVLYQPAALGPVVGAALRFGGVLSTLIPVTAVVAALPA